MKATKSRDGKKRFSLYVEFRVDRDLMYNCVVEELAGECTYDERMYKFNKILRSRNSVLSVVRKHLHSSGEWAGQHEVEWEREVGEDGPNPLMAHENWEPVIRGRVKLLFPEID